MTGRWRKFTIETRAEAEDFVTELLAELGIFGVEIRDRKAIRPGDTFEISEDTMPALLPDDGNAEVLFYLDETADAETLLENVRQGLSDLRAFTDVGSGRITEEWTESEDWVNNWKAFFHPFSVDDILIKPTWEPLPDDAGGKILLEIDPGTVFGTGAHETTKLSLRALSKFVKPGDRVLDVGTGSGILSILAVKRGASFTFGTDIDPEAIGAARENARRNGVPDDCFRIEAGDLLTDKNLQETVGFGVYDVVVANILADVILPLQKEAVKYLKPGGFFLASGIIEGKREALLSAFSENPGLELLEEERMGEWVAFALRKV